MRLVCFLACLLPPVLTWTESFLDLVKEADATAVQAAIDAGADLETRTEWGETPLTYAAHYNENAAAVQLLVIAVADAIARREDGESAWDLIQGNEALEGSPAYCALNDLRSQ